MSQSFEMIERVGISNECTCDAVKNVVEEANKEKRVYWFEIVEQRGRVTEDGKVEYQVKVQMGRKID